MVWSWTMAECPGSWFLLPPQGQCRWTTWVKTTSKPKFDWSLVSSTNLVTCLQTLRWSDGDLATSRFQKHVTQKISHTVKDWSTVTALKFWNYCENLNKWPGHLVSQKSWSNPGTCDGTAGGAASASEAGTWQTPQVLEAQNLQQKRKPKVNRVNWKHLAIKCLSLISNQYETSDLDSPGFARSIYSIQ